MFKKFITYTILLQLLKLNLALPVFDNDTELSEEENPFFDGRIVGGENTTIENHPYQVSLIKKGSHSCGGCIHQLNPPIIITAAHCANVNDDIYVRVGSGKLNEGGQVIKVQEIVRHNLYNSVQIDFDIAILILTEPLIESEQVKALETRWEPIMHGELATVTGWGTEKSGGSLQKQLQIVDIYIVNSYICDVAYGPNRITERMLCAGEEGKDSCQGDSGGPLVIGGKLAGVVSFGKGCAVRGYPGVYCNVPVLANWVQQTVAAVNAL